MIRNQHDRGIRPRQCQQGAQHRVMIAVGAVHHLLVIFKSSSKSPARRVILHESMAKMVNRIIVQRHEIPAFQLHQGRACGVNTAALGEDARTTVYPRILLPVHLCHIRQERAQMVLIKLIRMHTQRSQILPQALRMHRPLERGLTVLAGRFRHLMIQIRDHRATDRLSRMARPPAHDIAAQLILPEYIPQRFRPARAAADWADRAALRADLRKTMDAMFLRALAGRDRSP